MTGSPCGPIPRRTIGPSATAGPEITSLEDAERALLLSALADTRGDIQQIARRLGISRGTVYNKLAKFGISAAEYRKPRPVS